MAYSTSVILLPFGSHGVCVLRNRKCRREISDLVAS